MDNIGIDQEFDGMIGGYNKAPEQAWREHELEVQRMRKNFKYYILERDGIFQVVPVHYDNDPLHGRGSWTLFDATPYTTREDAEATLSTWAIRVAGTAVNFVRKQATFKELKEAI